MSQGLVETSVEAEGSDELKAFLVKYKQELKLGNTTKLNSLYDKLSDEVGYDDLMKFSETDLRPSLKECGLSSIQIGRLIGVIREIPQSIIYKHEHTVKVVSISNEEEDALNNINKAEQKIDEFLNDITINITKINENYKNGEKVINENLDQIIKNVNKRRNELLLNLKQIKQKKENKLSKQQNELKSHKKALNECYENSQKMIQDINMDKIKRKTKILTATRDLLQNKIIENYKLATTATINVKVNTKNINNVLSITGNIEQCETALPPTINVKTEDTSAMITIIPAKESSASQITEYKLEYVEHADDVKMEDDMKMDWKAITLKYNEKVEYKIKSLKPSTTYNIRASSKDSNGWGVNSTITAFITEQERVIFDVVADKYKHVIQSEGSVFKKTISDDEYISVASSKGYNSGIHEWKIRPKQNTGINAIAIISDLKSVQNGKLEWIHSFKGDFQAYFLYGGGGIYANTYSNADKKSQSVKKWKANDIITVRLNCDDWKLGYLINNEQIGEQHTITPNLTYYLIINTRSSRKATEYELVQ